MSKYRQRATVEAKQWLDEACAGYGAEDPKNPGAIIALGLVRTGFAPKAPDASKR